ncbi:MAG: hypothetical protein R2705_00260 [Ilumatobacteraceae bacterium]
MVRRPAMFNVREIAAHPHVAVLVMGTQRPGQGAPGPARPRSGPAGPPPRHRAAARRRSRQGDPRRCLQRRPQCRGLRGRARRGFEMGFDGKTLVHPSQVDPANAIWAPSDADIEYARRVIDAFEAAQAEGKGVVTVDGRMIENLHVDNARRTLAVADAIAALG